MDREVAIHVRVQALADSALVSADLGAPLVAFLRELQRRHAVAVLVVHHAKKGGGRVRAGQALRGSSECHVGGDSNLYLKKQGMIPSASPSSTAPRLPYVR